jgi:glycosyltransferase involved in cell wall biosynthesis
VITSASDTVPICLFESLASGVPVISTRVGWSPILIKNGENGYLVDSVDDIVEAMENIRKQRAEWFERRIKIRDSLKGYTLESWISENNNTALNLIKSRVA